MMANFSRKPEVIVPALPPTILTSAKTLKGRLSHLVEIADRASDIPVLLEASVSTSRAMCDCPLVQSLTSSQP